MSQRRAELQIPPEMIAPGMLNCITTMPAGSTSCSLDGTAWILFNGSFRVYWKFGRLAFGVLSRCTAVCSPDRRGGPRRPPFELSVSGGGTKY